MKEPAIRSCAFSPSKNYSGANAGRAVSSWTSPSRSQRTQPFRVRITRGNVLVRMIGGHLRKRLRPKARTDQTRLLKAWPDSRR